MTTGTLFRIASPSKAVTSAAIMALVEDGKVGIDSRVGIYCQLQEDDGGERMATAGRGWWRRGGRLPVAAVDAYGGDLLGREPHIAPLYEAKGLGPAAGNGWYTADKAEPICETMERLGTLPFVAQPGEAYVYGYNTDILGCVVEKASGMPLDEFVRSRITGPLGMKDTRFFVQAAERIGWR
jgi:CubicO group peptidase (beta-lactamase class C family)